MATTTSRTEPVRPTIVVALSEPERSEVVEAMTEAGFDTIPLPPGTSLAEAFSPGTTNLVAVVDVGGDPAGAAARVREARAGRDADALSVVYSAGEQELDDLEAAGLGDDEIILRPWSLDALRWRLEAMAIRVQAPAGSSVDAVLSGGNLGTDWAPAAPIYAVFNPKGGVGKTTIATTLAAALQLRMQQEVLLVDADTVTGHVGLSLGMPTGRTAADSWVDEDAGYGHEPLLSIAGKHSSGIKVVSLSSDPLRHPNLSPTRVADSILEARHSVDAIVIDLHPSYSEVNLAVFAIADRILVPVTPDLPAMRAAIQLKDVATEVGVRDRLSMIINRANSGVTVADMEATVGMPALAHIRSAGLHFVWSANAGKTIIDKFPRHPATGDFEHLAERLIAIHRGTPTSDRPRDTGSLLKNLFGRKVTSEA